MMLGNGDLRGSWLALLLGLLVAAASVLLSQHQLQQSQQQLHTAQQQLSTAHHTLATARSDQLVLPAYAALYRSLQQQHVIGDTTPNIGSIVEPLRPLALDLRYSVSTSQAYPAPSAAEFELALHPVYLQLELLHEGRLLEILDGLRTTGWFMLERCSIAPAATSLHAECTGGWLTIKHHAYP